MRCPANDCIEDLPYLQLRSHLRACHQGEEKFSSYECVPPVNFKRPWTFWNHHRNKHTTENADADSDSSDEESELNMQMEIDVSSLAGDDEQERDNGDFEGQSDEDYELDDDTYDSDDESFAKMMRQEVLTLSSSLGITEASTDHVVKLIRQVAVRCQKMDQNHFDSFVSTIDRLATPFKRKSAFRADRIELNALFENGILVTWRGQNILVHPWLLTVSADNLALNQIQQVQTSFAAGNPCRHCTANCNEFDKILRERDCNTRDVAWYKSHPPPTRGLRGPSPLNEIAGYHVADDAFCDIGHDIMEGEGRRLLGIVVRAVVCVGMSLTDINEKLCAFAVGHVDRDSLRAPIPDDVLIGNSISGQKAAQTATLLRLFPFIFPLDPAVPNPEIRQLFFCFAELLRLLQTFYVTPGDIDLVRVLTEKYITLAWKVVDLDVPPSRSSKTRASRPTFKTHVLLHYAECLRSLGPVGQLSTLPFEQLNSYLKRRSYVTKNFICLPWTMAVHIQRVLWAMRLQHSPDVVPGKCISSHAISAVARAVLNRQDTLRFRRHGTLYAAGDVVSLTDRKTFVPAKIDCFVHTDGSWKMIVALGSTATFDINRQCCFFALDGRATLASFSDLSDPLPHDGDNIAFMPRHSLSHQ